MVQNALNGFLQDFLHCCLAQRLSSWNSGGRSAEFDNRQLSSTTFDDCGDDRQPQFLGYLVVSLGQLANATILSFKCKKLALRLLYTKKRHGKLWKHSRSCSFVHFFCAGPLQFLCRLLNLFGVEKMRWTAKCPAAYSMGLLSTCLSRAECGKPAFHFFGRARTSAMNSLAFHCFQHCFGTY